MAIAGQEIEAGDWVMLGLDGKAFGLPEGAFFIGKAAERIREGFRISVKDEVVREDDA
jgi:predicted RecA/RadA family phage recombinase